MSNLIKILFFFFAGIGMMVGQINTVSKQNTIIKSNHNFGLTNPMFDDGSPMTYDASQVNSKGAAFKFDYTNQGGTDFDGYPSGAVGGFKVNNVYISGNVNACGMPVQIKNLTDKLRINWKVSQSNANNFDDKWWATINVIFDEGTATSEPVDEARDYDLVIQNVSYEQDDFSDLINPGGRYWYFARNSNGTIKPFTLYLNGNAYQWAVRYKFFDYPAGHVDVDKNDKVHIKFIPIDNAKPIPNLDHSLKQFIDCTKNYIANIPLPANAPELALANQKVADENLWIKSISAGYEVYEGSSTLSNDYFYTTLDNTAPTALANLSATSQNTNVILNWAASTDAAFDSYTVYRSTNGGSYTAVASSVRTNSFTDKSLVNGIYDYYVTTKDRSFNESPKSNIANIKLGTSPNAPSSIVATLINCSSVKIMWTDNANDETGFNILKSSDGVNFTLAQTVAENINSFSFSDLNENTNYTFKVNAFNPIGTSIDVTSNSVKTVACNQITTSLDPNIRDKTNLDIGFNRRSDSGAWWTYNSFKGVVAEMNPDVVRYPGGTQANYWDWRTGKFLDNTDKTWGENMEVLRIPQFVKVIPQRTKIVYVVNMARPTPATGVSVNASEAILKSTATLDLKINDMLAAITEFEAQGKLPYAIELGNEFYFGNEEAGIFEIKEVGDIFYGGWDAVNQKAYEASSKKDATVFVAKFYLEQCKKIVAAIKAQYPTMKFAIVTTRLEENAPAREVWNNTIFTELNSNPNYASLKSNIDAVTQHHYLNETYGDQTIINNITTAKVAIAEGIQYPIDNQLDYNLVPANYKIWLTEYGVTKTNAELTWAAGLRYAALVHSWIKRGSKIGQLDYHYISESNVVKASSPMKLAPIGIAAKLIAKASADMNEMQEINFANNPISVNQIKSLYGYKFKNAKKETILIINTSNTNLSEIPFNNLFTYTGQPVMTQFYSNAPFISNVFEGNSNLLSNLSNVNNTLELKNFSLTVVEVSIGLPNTPSSLVATPVDCTSANLMWMDNSNDETGFNILKSSDGVNFTLAQTVTANIGSYNFTDLNASTSYTFKVNAFNNFGTSSDAISNTITTIACPVNYALSVTAINGSVTPNNGSYLEGSNLVLTAMPDAGYQFTGWSGDIVSTENPISIVMNSNKNIVANFALLPVYYTLTVTTTNGSVTPNSGSYLEGSNLVLTAIPDAGYEFSGWSGAVVSAENPLNIVMNSNKNIVANFVLLPVYHTLTTTAINGSITPNSGSYLKGSNLTITAIPNADYKFSSWSGDVVSTVNPLSIVIDSDKNIVANFISTITSIAEETSDSSINVYPNPTKNNITVEVLDADLENGSIKVYDCMGREINNTKISNSKTNFDLKGESGIYFIKIYNNGTSFVRKILYNAE
jgi:hypothetical protein